MPEQNDSSHGRGIADLRRALSINRKLGDRYQPSNPFIKNDALQQYCDDCEAKLNAVFTAETAFNEARGQRRDAFEGLDSWSTQLVSTLKTSGASTEMLKTGRALIKKIRGERVSKESAPARSDSSAEEIREQISVAQTSFNNRLDHARKLVALVDTLGNSYQANAASMEANALKTRLGRLDATNQQVNDLGASYTTLLIERDRLFYDAASGAPARMNAIRDYYQSAFGASSAERKMLNGLSVRDRSLKRLNAV